MRRSATGIVFVLPFFVLAQAAVVQAAGSSSTSSNTPLKAVVVNFETRNAHIMVGSHPEAISEGLDADENFFVKVININTLRYSATATATAGSSFSNVPSQFQQFEIPASSTTPPAGPPARPAPPASGPNGTQVQSSTPQPSLKTAKDALPYIVGGLTLLAGLGTEAQTLLQGVKTSEDATRVKGEMPTEVSELLGKNGQISGLDTILYNDGFGEIVVDWDHAQPADATSVATQLFAKLPLIQAELQSAQSSDTEAQADLATITKLQDNQATIISNIQQAAELAQTAETGNYMTTYLGPFYVTGDNTTITINFTDTVTPASAVPPYAITITTASGFKIDFSAGVLVTSLVDKTYTTTPASASGGSTTTSYTVNPPTSEGNTVVTAAFTHFYFRNTGSVRPGITFGIALRTNPIYALGGSLLIGRDQRLVLTFGEAFGDVVREVPGTPATISTATVPTSNVFMDRPFYALSYNF